MISFIISFIGYFLIWIAVFLDRKDDDRIYTDSYHLWFLIGLVFIGAQLIIYSSKM